MNEWMWIDIFIRGDLWSTDGRLYGEIFFGLVVDLWWSCFWTDGGLMVDLMGRFFLRF